MLVTVTTSFACPVHLRMACSSVGSKGVACLLQYVSRPNEAVEGCGQECVLGSASALRRSGWWVVWCALVGRAVEQLS